MWLPANAKRVAGKYGAVKTQVDGITFSSKAEARRYGELQLLVRAGLIADLKLQPKFDLTVNGVKVCAYVADFQSTRKGVLIIEDVKSPATKTRVYAIKKKLMQAIHGLHITETA